MEISMNGAKVAFAAALVASAGVAQVAPQAPVTGWWRAELHHGGEVQSIYLHFKDRDGKLIVSFSNPEIDIAETGIGLASLGKDSVDIAGIGWTLKRDGEALTGVIPDALVAVYRMDARFVRSPPPEPVGPQ